MSIGSQILARIANDLTREHPRLNDDTKGQLLGYWKAAEGLIRPIVTEEKRIRESPRWDKYERKEKLAALLPSVQNVLKGLLHDKQQIEARLAKLTTTLQTVPKIGDPVVRAITNMEIRQTFRGMDESKRSTAFVEAAKNNQTAVMDALLTGHDRLIAEEVRERGIALWAEQALPNEWEARAQVQELHEQLASLEVQVNRWVAELES